jgi:antitoxin VapB
MSLNIKSPEVHQLARELARKTGQTMTEVVTEALREHLHRVERKTGPKALSEDLLAIGRRCARTLKGKSVDHASMLYDKRGLPR